VLASFDSVVWSVKVAANARIDAVYYNCPRRCEVQGSVPAAQDLPAKVDKFDRLNAYSYASPDRDGEKVLEGIADALGIPVMSAQGPNESGAFEVPLELDRSVLLEIVRAHADAGRQRTVSPPGPFVLVEGGAIVRKPAEARGTQLIPKRRIRAVAAANGEYFGLGLGELLRIDPKTGDVESVETPPDLPRIGWSGGIAYDERSRYVVITQSSPLGVHSLYAPETGAWQTVPVERTGGGLIAIAYSQALQALYGLRSGRDTNVLVSLGPDLNVGREIELPKNVFTQRDVPVSGDAAVFKPPLMLLSAQMASSGASLVVCRGSESLGRAYGRSACLLIDPRSSEVRLLNLGDAK
jgi:hypothetical protein